MSATAEDLDEREKALKAMRVAVIDGSLKKYDFRLGKVSLRQGGMLIDYELVDLRGGPSVFLTRRLDQIASSALWQLRQEEAGIMPRAPEVPSPSLELMVLLVMKAREARGL